MKKQFTKREHMKRCLNSLIIREMPIETAVKLILIHQIGKFKSLMIHSFGKAVWNQTLSYIANGKRKCYNLYRGGFGSI